MKKKTIITTAVALTAAAGSLFFLNKEKIMDKTAYADNAAESCNCEAGWFPHEQTPAPAEGDGSPFDSSSTTNCIFHQWSW